MSTSAPAAGGPEAAGQAAPQPVSQPSSAGGQGQGQGGGSSQQQAGFNWGLFPGVPEGQRELLEPHLRDVQGYVTRLEQAQAPYRSLMNVVQPDTVPGLVEWLNSYSQNPVETWLGMAQALQQEGHIQNPEFNLEQLQQMIQQQQAPVAGAEDMPPWAQEMMGTVQQLQQAYQQQQQQAQDQATQAEAQEQARMLAEAHATMKDQLVKSGIPETIITPERMTAALIVHNGDPQAALTEFNQFREEILKGFTETNGKGPRPPSMPNGAPQAPQGGLRNKSGDPFRSASRGAEQFLKQSLGAAGQE